ncbi:MAG TPA: dethiobiotin synthase [Chitinispirillaceae bacterium]|nr:dethiobiotin synthase [Chitinispirillaceae bacterium]
MNSIQSFFISGTDTDIGKTYISRLLVDTLSQFHPSTYMKPVQTGCTEDRHGNLCAPDYDYVMKGKATPSLDITNHLPYRYKTPCSPHLAAVLENGPEIEIDVILEAYRRLATYSMNVIVEGAGGVMAPINSRQYMVDVMKAMNLPVILVSSPHLGTINHTLMSIDILKRNSIRLAGIVMNNARNVPVDYLYKDTISFIAKKTDPVPLLETGYNSVKEQELHAFCRKLSTTI